MELTKTSDQGSQPAPELIYLIAETRTHGTTIRSPLSVPPGYAALIAIGGRPYDVVGPGDYIIGEQHFPQIAQKFKLQPGQPFNKPVDLSVYLMNVTGVSVPWRATPVVTKSHAFGLQYCDISGRCSMRVNDPAAFYTTLVKEWGRILKKQPAAVRAKWASVSTGQQAEVFVGTSVEISIAASLESSKYDPKTTAWPPITMEQTVSTAAVMALQAAGLQCLGFELDPVPPLQRAPCAKCGAADVPTAYGIYRRTISLLYVRFGAKREGNFCLSCAAKVSAMYNCVMLVCGWWGYVGIVLTPIYLTQNCFNFLRSAFGTRIAAGAAPVAVANQAGVWPPPPTPDWAREVQE